MLEISTSGLMSEDGKRSGLFRAQPPRPSSTLQVCDPKAVSDHVNLAIGGGSISHARELLEYEFERNRAARGADYSANKILC